MPPQSHLMAAQFALEAFKATTSTNLAYVKGILRRAEVEALVSIAESLEGINQKMGEK